MLSLLCFCFRAERQNAVVYQTGYHHHHQNIHSYIALLLTAPGRSKNQRIFQKKFNSEFWRLPTCLRLAPKSQAKKKGIYQEYLIIFVIRCFDGEFPPTATPNALVVSVLPLRVNRIHYALFCHKLFEGFFLCPVNKCKKETMI